MTAPTESAAWFEQRSENGVHVLFLGKGYEGSRRRAFELHTGRSIDVAWAKQVHGAEVLAGRPGLCGDGDALVTGEVGLPLSIATADCVPVLVRTGRRVAAAHAGWRGLAAGVLGATLREISSAEGSIAWIGPSIGPCCYEVSYEVADQVAVASGSHEVVRPGRGERPHLDLSLAAERQLRAAGVRSIHASELCTRCATRELWSYRREGPKAGRNLAFIWLDEPDASC